MAAPNLQLAPLEVVHCGFYVDLRMNIHVCKLSSLKGGQLTHSFYRDALMFTSTNC